MNRPTTAARVPIRGLSYGPFDPGADEPFRCPTNLDVPLIVHRPQGGYEPATTDQILAAARRAIDQKVQRGAEFSSPAKVKEYVRAKLGGFDHEVFAVMFLDARHRLIEYAEMFHGTLDRASVHTREVLKAALRLNAAAVIFAHNHPSGVAEPSNSDRAETLRLKEALNLVEIRILDHVIVAGNATVTFAERGWL